MTAIEAQKTLIKTVKIWKTYDSIVSMKNEPWRIMISNSNFHAKRGHAFASPMPRYGIKLHANILTVSPQVIEPYIEKILPICGNRN
jgi:hypothetical protein